MEGLKSEKIKNEFDNIIQADGPGNPREYVSKLTETLLKCASDVGIKTAKQNKKYASNNAPWFDKDCVRSKQALNNLAQKLTHDPNNYNIRETLFMNKRKFRHLIRKKKSAYKLSILQKMHVTKSRDIKQFWKLLDRISPKTVTAKTGNVSNEAWLTHFHSLFKTDNASGLPENRSDTGPLDHEINMDELIKASDILKGGKAPGLDNINNEMIQLSLQYHPHIFLVMFNKILRCGGDIPSWEISLLVPIHKQGSVDDPGNYRGISLLSCLAKFFHSILNNRLLEYCLDNKVLSPNQLGFLPGNRTSDAHLIIYNLIRKYCHRKGAKIYGCFVDFSKAFDSVPRDILLKKLLDIGITGKFFDHIKNMYNNDLVCVKINGQMSEEIKTSKGVRQGCILSPLLFNIFMSDLPRKLNQNCNVSISDEVKINCLLWADDIILLSETEEGLRSLLKDIDTYCKENGLNINIDKTKCMIFNKTGRLIRRNFYLGNIKLENVRSYKYLGLMFTPSGEIKTALDDLRARALKAYMKMRGSLGTGFNRYINDSIMLFDSLIKPILLYSSDFWGCLKLPQNNPIENLDMQFSKQVFGV